MNCHLIVRQTREYSISAVAIAELTPPQLVQTEPDTSRIVRVSVQADVGRYRFEEMIPSWKIVCMSRAIESAFNAIQPCRH